MRFINNSDTGAEEDRLELYELKVDELVSCIARFGLRNKQAFVDRLSNRILTETPPPDVADLSSIDESDDEDDEPGFVGKINTPPFGKWVLPSWKTKFYVKDWPRVVWENTRITPKEEAEIRAMDFAELNDFVRKEWPERVNVIFKPGYDGMLIEDMRQRVINRLRLTYKELQALTDTGKRNQKTPICQYYSAVRPGVFKQS